MNNSGATSARTLVVIGLGLIGGSIAKAARQRGLFQSVIGVGRDPERMQQAVAAGVVDEGSTDATEAVSNASIVVVCTPVDLIASEVVRLQRFLPADALVTDVGSTKARLCRQIHEQLPEGSQFLGSHPLAGSEKTGFENAREDLLDGACVVVTPDEQTSVADVERIEQFWKALGGRVSRMSPEEHDERLARTSHLPHLAAAALAGVVREEDLPLAATGFGDTTRVAAGDPSLWTAIFLENASATLAATELYLQQLSEFKTAIENQDAGRITELLQQGKNRRDKWERE